MGAKIIEKHFILNKTIGGPDASFSMDKEEFKIDPKIIDTGNQTIWKFKDNDTHNNNPKSKKNNKKDKGKRQGRKTGEEKQRDCGVGTS